MHRAPSFLLSALVAGCATTADVDRAVAPGMSSSEVASRVGKPTTVGKLVDGGAYWDYSRQPYYIERVAFGPDDRVRDVRNLLTEANFENLKPGMTPDDVLATVGPAFVFNRYGNGTTVWTYRYKDLGIYKLLHVTFDASARMLRYETQWDPNVYSRKDRGGK
jgi:outer membrane protein assembly factor BamE (lipoprotein component of BamABCDE complex)